MSGHMFVFGHGYSATSLSSRLIAAGGWHVTGTTRSAARAIALAEQGVVPIVWPGTDIVPYLRRTTHILVSIAPDESGDPVLQRAGALIADIAGQLDWVGYLSTTAVYGNRNGGWVSEDSTLKPATVRGHRRVAAEKAWRSLAARSGIPLHIFRLAGIYGPGRGPVQSLLAGRKRSIIKENQYFNRIHVMDIARLLHASIRKPDAGSTYNCCDSLPAPPQTVRAYAAQLLGLPPPDEVPFEVASPSMSPMARSFYAESKKVSSKNTLARLGISLKYPDYKSGLRAICERMD